MNRYRKLTIQLILFVSFVFTLTLTTKGKKETEDKLFPSVFQSLDKKAQQRLKALPIEEADWLFQDFGEDLNELFNSQDGKAFLPKINSISKQIELSAELKKQIEVAKTGDFEKGLQAYLEFCRERRKVRLNELIINSPELVFLENKEFGNAPRLDMSMTDGPYRGRPFAAGASIHRLKLNEQGIASASPLLVNQNGMLRDIDVSFDGKRILFAQKESISDDWQIYEMNLLTGTSRSITNEKGIANIQPCYLPDGILFHSTRCVTVVDCNETIDAVNIYRSDLNGKNIQRLTVDQVSTQYPALMPDGRIIYTRWEYNDRGQIFPQALFTMYPDGSHQAAFYGNNSWYPTSLIQARGIPGSKKVMTIIAGHHTGPMGKLALIDVGAGMEEGKGIKLLAPERDADYKRRDKAEQDEQLFQYPHPLSEDEFLVGFSLFGRTSSKHFGIYWMNKDGERELLAGDVNHIYRKPMPLASRPVPRRIPSMVDAAKKTGTYYVSNVYVGPGLEGITPGTIKSLRVIALDFRSSGIRTNYNRGVGGNARVNTPVSVGGSWDTKTILGDAKVYDDGSCYFEVPAHTPVYFQAIDQNGASVQSMRSWSTLMPGESFSCVGCHESKLTTPVNSIGQSMALKAGPSKLEPFYDIDEGFSYTKDVQPILDQHCIKCHQGESIRENIHKQNSKAPAYGLFTGYLAKSQSLTNTYQLPNSTDINYVKFTWAEKAPKNWSISYLKNGDWHKISTLKTSQKDSTQLVEFSTINAKQIRLNVSPEKKEIHLRNLVFLDKDKNEIAWGMSDKPFSLMATPVDEPISGRRWSESYLRLIGAFYPGTDPHLTLDAKPNSLVNWISPQSEPTMLKPYETGSSQSEIIKMLEKGHGKTKLNREEMDKLRCWIDLAVPYCGTYDESNIWSEEEMDWFKQQNEKRKRLATSQEK